MDVNVIQDIIKSMECAVNAQKTVITQLVNVSVLKTVIGPTGNVFATMVIPGILLRESVCILNVILIANWMSIRIFVSVSQDIHSNIMNVNQIVQNIVP